MLLPIYELARISCCKIWLQDQSHNCLIFLTGEVLHKMLSSSFIYPMYLNCVFYKKSKKKVKSPESPENSLQLFKLKNSSAKSQQLMAFFTCRPQYRIKQTLILLLWWVLMGKDCHRCESRSSFPLLFPALNLHRGTQQGTEQQTSIKHLHLLRVAFEGVLAETVRLLWEKCRARTCIVLQRTPKGGHLPGRLCCFSSQVATGQFSLSLFFFICGLVSPPPKKKNFHH